MTPAPAAAAPLQPAAAYGAAPQPVQQHAAYAPGPAAPAAYAGGYPTSPGGYGGGGQPGTFVPQQPQAPQQQGGGFGGMESDFLSGMAGNVLRQQGQSYLQRGQAFMQVGSHWFACPAPAAGREGTVLLWSRERQRNQPRANRLPSC